VDPPKTAMAHSVLLTHNYQKTKISDRKVTGQVQKYYLLIIAANVE